MIYQDRIYGQTKISESVILELIKSPSLQRLKGVDQAGYFTPARYYINFTDLYFRALIFIGVRKDGRPRKMRGGRTSYHG